MTDSTKAILGMLVIVVLVVIVTASVSVAVIGIKNELPPPAPVAQQLETHHQLRASEFVLCDDNGEPVWVLSLTKDYELEARPCDIYYEHIHVSVKDARSGEEMVDKSKEFVVLEGEE